MDENTHQTNAHDGSGGGSWMPVLIIILVLIAGGVAFLLSSPSPEDTPADNGTTTSELAIPDSWQLYTNDQFDFSVQLPPNGWQIVEAPEDQIAPKFNIYKEGTLSDDVQPPLDHFTEAVYVGVYPHGIPTEGVLGQTTTTTLPFQEPTNNSRTYVLDDDTEWAVFTNFTEWPESWREHGFVWGRTLIENLSVTCMSDGQEVSQQECDPMLGDTLIRSGSVNTDDWQTVRRILSSFQFTEDNGSAGQ